MILKFVLTIQSSYENIVQVYIDLCSRLVMIVILYYTFTLHCYFPGCSNGATISDKWRDSSKASFLTYCNASHY